MSEHLHTLSLRRGLLSQDRGESNRLAVGSFYGGRHDGQCIQITLDTEYAQLVPDEVAALINVLDEWLKRRIGVENPNSNG